MDVLEGGECRAAMECASGCCIKSICQAEYADCPKYHDKCTKR